jgi:hypothetical protein
MQPTPTKDDIIREFEGILEHNGEVTNLDVKMALRGSGFWATQAEVSAVVTAYFDALEYDATHADSLNFRVDTNHRVYFTTPKGTVTTTPWTPSVKKADPIGDWECSSYSDPSATVETIVSVTRNQAKSQYASDYGVKYIDVKAIKA